MKPDLNSFCKLFDKIAYGRSETQVFDDFLDIVICCLSGQQYEDEYLGIIKKYSKEGVLQFCELFAEMIIIMDNDGNGLKDCLGHYFEQHISHGKNGQFFTPEHVCDFMAAITMDEGTIGKRIFDPACGSVRMLLSAAKQSRNNYFFAADIDFRCVKMAAINLCLNGLIGEVAWMDTLAFQNKHWGGYTIYLEEKRNFVPTIRKLEPNTGYIYNQSEPPAMIKEKQPVIQTEQTEENKSQNTESGQLRFF